MIGLYAVLMVATALASALWVQDARERRVSVAWSVWGGPAFEGIGVRRHRA